MKAPRLLAYGVVLAVFASATPTRAAIPVLPAEAAAPFGAGDPNELGFVVRTVQAPNTNQIANSYIRAIQQLNGTLLDHGELVANEALPGPNADGSYYSDAISFELTGQPVQGFNASMFPGIPGSGGHNDYFAVEAVGFLELAAGRYTLGMSVAADRTDVNNDDSYVVSCGVNPRNFFGTEVGEYERFAPPFAGNVQNTNYFTFDVPVDGTYPFRIVYWQTGLGANLQFFSLDTNTGTIKLINDPAFPFDSIVSYRKLARPQANGPYVAEVSPLPDVSGIAASDPIVVVLKDGLTPLADASVKLYLNNAQVTAQNIVRSGNTLTLTYTPNATRPEINNTVRVEYDDNTGLKATNSWSFQIVTTGGPTTVVTGQWDFDYGDLRATVGTGLEYFGGPAGETASKTQFGTTRDFAISDINGQPAIVMRVPGDLTNSIGYVMHHGIAPNGGGTRVNQYTLIMDVFVDTTGPGAAAFLQISSLNNTDDGDLFWQGNQFGQGGGGYNGTGQFTAGAWHRFAAAYDEAANPPVVTKYVDGIKQDDWTANQGLDNPRRALLPSAILFGDGDQDERRVMYVNSIQIRSGKLSDAEMVALGGPDSLGIPETLAQPKVAGQWDFERGDLSATIGKPLVYFDPDGAGLTASLTQFGDTTTFGISDIDGVPVKLMRVPGELTNTVGYVMTHGIAPNGGGTRVNQYTLIMDVYVDPTGPGAAAFLQISSLNNTDDGDLFWQGNQFGQGGGGYNGTGQFTAGAWHRFAAAYDEAATPPVVVKYVDGIKQDEWTANQGLDNPRRALLPTAILFGDGDQDERRAMYVSSIQIRPYRMSDAEMTALGGPQAGGIPVVLPASSVSGQWDFERGDLSATIGAPLTYFDPDGAGLTASLTQFGDTTTLGVPDINGVPARVMRVPGDLTNTVGYVMNHRIAPNGGGTKVNQFTLVMDVYVDPAGPGAASFLQMSSLNNTDDGDLFWQGNEFGQGAGGYNGTGQFTAGAWHRFAAAYNMAATPPVVVKYVDGIFQDNWTAGAGLDTPRRTLLPTSILFGDGDQDERRVMYVNSIQIHSRPLSNAEMQALGGPQPEGIPAVISVETPPRLAVGKLENRFILLWPTSVSGYTLQSSPTLDPATANWTAVAGAENNYASVTLGPGNTFFRLIK